MSTVREVKIYFWEFSILYP